MDAISVLLQYFLHEDDMSAFSPAMNVSWYEAKNICISYNATLLSFSSYNDVLTVQAFMWEILNDVLPMPIFLGLKWTHIDWKLER